MTGNQVSEGRFLTEYNDAYPTCDTTRVELLIYSALMDPDTITAIFGVEPTSSVTTDGTRKVRGSIRKNKHSRPQQNGWFLSSENFVSSKDLRRHLDWLLDILDSKADEFKTLQEQDDVKCVIRFYWWSAHNHGGPALWPLHLRRLAQLNMECNFEFAFYGDEPVI